MLDEKNRPLHTHPSLLLLQMALIAAEREFSPPHPLRVDSNERLAMQLIARMQAEYRRQHPFLVLQDDHHDSIKEMAAFNA